MVEFTPHPSLPLLGSAALRGGSVPPRSPALAESVHRFRAAPWGASDQAPCVGVAGTLHDRLSRRFCLHKCIFDLLLRMTYPRQTLLRPSKMYHRVLSLVNQARYSSLGRGPTSPNTPTTARRCAPALRSLRSLWGMAGQHGATHRTCLARDVDISASTGAGAASPGHAGCRLSVLRHRAPCLQCRNQSPAAARRVPARHSTPLATCSGAG